MQIYLDAREIPAFHPIKHNDDSSWYPSNEAANNLVMLRYILDDIETLANIRKTLNNENEKKLILKYIIIETKSLFIPLDTIKKIIYKTPLRVPGNENPIRHIQKEELEIINEYFKDYNKNRKKVEKKITEIRNKIGAHREIKPWNEIIKLYSEIEPKLILDLINSIIKIRNYLHIINIYDWTKTNEDGSIQILGPRIYADELVTKGGDKGFGGEEITRLD